MRFLTQLQSLLDQTAQRSPQQTRHDLERLIASTDRLTAGMTQLRDGLQIADLTGGLVGDYLDDLGGATSTGTAAGFYVPPQAFADPAFQAGHELLFTPDGRTARMVAVWQINPYGSDALDAVPQIAATAALAATDTSLTSAHFAVAGLASLSADMRDQMWIDFAVCALVALIGVTVVLMVLLRSNLHEYHGRSGIHEGGIQVGVRAPWTGDNSNRPPVTPVAGATPMQPLRLYDPRQVNKM
ncbi:MAG: MMPL family transporter [Mycobacterium sp.]